MGWAIRVTLVGLGFTALCGCGRRDSTGPSNADSTVGPFAGTIILARATDRAITASLQSVRTAEVWLEYGTQSGIYPHTSAHVSLQSGVPANLDLQGLQADTRYVYRVRTAADSGSGVEPPAEHAFRTQRSRGSIFSFTVDADPPWGEINFDSSVYASSGYLRIRVSPSQATVEYVKVYAPGLGAGMQTGTVATSYTLAPRP